MWRPASNCLGTRLLVTLSQENLRVGSNSRSQGSDQPVEVGWSPSL